MRAHRGEGFRDEYVRELNKDARPPRKEVSPKRKKLDLLLLAGALFAGGAQVHDLLRQSEKPWDVITKKQMELRLKSGTPTPEQEHKRLEKTKEYLKMKYGVTVDIESPDKTHRDSEKEKVLGMEAYSVGAVRTALDSYPPSFIKDAAALQHISVVELGLEDRLEKLTGKGHQGRSAAVLSKGERGSSVGTVYLQFYRDPAQKKSMLLDDVASDLYYNLPKEVHKKVFELALAKEKNKNGVTSDSLTAHDQDKAKIAADSIMEAERRLFQNSMNSRKKIKEPKPIEMEVLDDLSRLSGQRMDGVYWVDLANGQVGQDYWSFGGERQLPETAE